MISGKATTPMSGKPGLRAFVSSAIFSGVEELLVRLAVIIRALASPPSSTMSLASRQKPPANRPSCACSSVLGDASSSFSRRVPLSSASVASPSDAGV